MCVLKVKNPHQKYTVHRKRNEILQAIENGKIIHMKQTTRIHSHTICTRNGETFFVFRVCARDLFHFKAHFRVFRLNTHLTVRYICTVCSFP